MTEQDRFLTVEELLARWNMDPRTLEKIIDVGGLGYFCPTGVRVRRFALSLVMEYEQKHFKLNLPGDTSHSTTLR